MAGFLAEVNRALKAAEAQQRRNQAAANRAQMAAQREAVRAAAAAERARVAAQKADARERAQAEKAAKEAYVQSRIAEVDEKNAELAEISEQLEGILAFTLDYDDFVDLESLKIKRVEHPAFAPPKEVAEPQPKPPAPTVPTEPRYEEPAPKRGLFANKKKHEVAIQEAQDKHKRDVTEWRDQVAKIEREQQRRIESWQQAEKEREAKLEQLKREYEEECKKRETDAERQNRELDELISGLAFDVESAISDYVAIVLSNSVYPEFLPVTTEHRFSLENRELALNLRVPDPSKLPTTKLYKYNKSQDEITETPLSAKEQKDRYANVVWQIAVRTLHEIFEADRAGKIHSIALQVATEAVLPTTGKEEVIPFVEVAAARDSFLTFDLKNVIPHATLTHLGAAMSKSPFDLMPAQAGRGMRKGD